MQAGATSTIPFGGSNSDSVILAEGYQMKPGESLISPHQIASSPGYFETLQLPLIAGRFFNESDTDTAPPRHHRRRAAREPLLARTEPVGRRMWQPDDVKELTTGPGPKARFFTIVGVVRRVSLGGLVESVTIARRRVLLSVRAGPRQLR